MDRQEFSVCLNSLHFPEIPADIAARDRMNAADHDRLAELHKWLQSRMKTAAKPVYTANRLDGSIFGCCFSNGFAMLMCRADPDRRETALTGFFIRRDESLRTAWQLVRIPLLFICAGGWDKTGVVSMTPEEINAKAYAYSFPQDYQQRLIGFGMEMLGSPIPFSFAFSGYPVDSAPLKFNYAHSQNEAARADADVIVINPEALRSSQARVSKKYFGIQNFELIHAGKKQFYEMKMKELSGSDSQKSEKAALKDALNQYQADDVWYIRISGWDGEYTELLDVYTCNKLYDGSIPYEELVIAMKRAEINSKNYFLSQSQYSGIDPNTMKKKGEQKRTPDQKKDERPSGVFGKFLKK